MSRSDTCTRCMSRGHTASSCPSPLWALVGQQPQPPAQYVIPPCGRCEHYPVMSWDPPCKACLQTRPSYTEFKEQA